jgi:hypothetical protein
MKFNILMAMVLMSAGGLTLHAQQINAKASSVSGSVTYAAPDAKSFQPLTVGTELAPGTRVKTGRGSEAIIVIVTGAAVKVSENSEMTIESMSIEGAGANPDKRKALLSLKSGTVSALIDPKRSKQTDFKIATPYGTAAARGTFYAVTVEDGKAYVGVKHGKVGVSRTPLTKAKDS